MGWLRDWIMAVTCAAMALALLEGLVPDGAGKKVCRLAGGLALLRGELDSYERALAEQSEERYKTIIAERTAAYIVDKAAEMGFSCRVEVTVDYDDNKLPCPREITAWGEWTPDQRDALSRIMAEDLGVPAERQHFEENLP